MGTRDAAMYGGGVCPWALGQQRPRPRPPLPKPLQLDVNHDDDLLFNASFSPRVALTYQSHLKDMRKMVRQQGEGFWVRFVASLRSHAERRRLMDGVAFARAEAVFIDMLRMLTCRDGLEELSRLVSSLRAMHAVIAANDYPVLLDPVLRALMTCYDKPLEGLRLYFRFVSALVALFRRWRTALAAARSPAADPDRRSPAPQPWQPPPHWQEGGGGGGGGGGGEWSESTFEGHLLAKYGARALPRMLGLRPSWLPATSTTPTTPTTPPHAQAQAQEEEGEEEEQEEAALGVRSGVGVGAAMAKRGRRKSRRRRSQRSAYASASRGRGGRGREAEGSDGESSRCGVCLMAGDHFGESAFLRSLHKSSCPPGEALHQSSQFVVWTDSCSMDELCDQRLETSCAENNARLMLEMSGMDPYYPMEGMLPLPWMGHEGNLLHPPPPVGFYDPALMGFVPPPLPQPPSQMRRNGQQNRYFHQRRERNVSYPVLKKDNDVSHFERNPQGPDVCPMTQRHSKRGVSSCRNQWQRKEKINRDVVVHSKQILQDEPSGLFTSHQTLRSYPANGIRSNDYVAAVGEALGKELATLVETRKQERGESQKREHLDLKSASYDKCNFKKIKRQFVNANVNGIGKSVQTISAKDGKEFGMMRKSLMKIEGNKMPYHYFGRAKNVKGKFFDGTNISNSSKMIKLNQTTDCSLVAFQARNKNITKNSKQDVKAIEKRKRWRNVWTRRRNGEDTHLMSETTSEVVIKDSDQNYQRYLSRRDCISGNVPDILKQVDNCELKNFWKMNDEAPKPQRKSRAPKREPKGRQEIQTAPFPRGSHSSSRLEEITPVVTLDIVPAREPEEKDSKPQHLVSRTLSQPQIFHSAEKRTCGVSRRSQSTARCASGVGWYEEMLAEDKNKEMERGHGEETVAPFEGRCDSTGAKRNKVRKWKRKQKYNQRAKAEDEGNYNGPKNDQYALRSKNIESKFLMSTLTIKENKCEVLNDSANCVVDTNGFPTGLTTAVEVRKNVWEDSGQMKEMNIPTNENVNKSLIDLETSHLQYFTKQLLSKITETEILKGALVTADTHPETKIQSKDERNHQFMLQEIPETIHLVQSFNTLTGCLGMNRFESIAIEKIKMTVCKNIMCKNPETDSQRKRQEILAKVLKCLAGYKIYASLPTKRNVPRYFFPNSERLKAIDNVTNEGADVKDANT